MDRAAWVEIDLDGLAHNLQSIRHWLKSNGANEAQIMPVIKAGAYGHGIREIACELASLGIKDVAVATMAEALAVKEACSELSVLILGYIPPEAYEKAIINSISITVTSPAQAITLDASAKCVGLKALAHLKVNTGMNRLGFDWQQEGIIEASGITSLKNITVQGLFTHCPNAGSSDDSFIRIQAERFIRFAEVLRDHGMQIPLLHMANSSTTLQHPEYAFDMVRLASLVFGLVPPVASNPIIEVKPFLTIRAKIVEHRWIQVGEGVSYGLKWRAERPTRIGVLPIGHVDMPIRGSDKGKVLVRGEQAPIVGTICMDQMLVDLTETSAFTGDEVTILGKANDCEISLQDICTSCSIEPFRLLCGISNRLPRIYYRSGRAICFREATTLV